MDALVEMAIQVVGSGDIKLPDIFSFPGSEGFRVDGLDIGIGEQAEHFEALGSAYFFGEGANGLRIENIAAESGAHIEMAGNEEEDGFAIGRVEIEAFE